MIYAFIENNKIVGVGSCPTVGDTQINVEITSEISDNIERYIWNGAEIVLDPDYEEKQAQKERECIGNLQVTKRVFALALGQLGVSYSQLKELIATNEQAQLEWDLCVELQRKNPLLDAMAEQLGLSSETLDKIFRQANGEEP